MLMLHLTRRFGGLPFESVLTRRRSCLSFLRRFLEVKTVSSFVEEMPLPKLEQFSSSSPVTISRLRTASQSLPMHAAWVRGDMQVM